jgi:hypothetical protein
LPGSVRRNITKGVRNEALQHRQLATRRRWKGPSSLQITAWLHLGSLQSRVWIRTCSTSRYLPTRIDCAGVGCTSLAGNRHAEGCYDLQVVQCKLVSEMLWRISYDCGSSQNQEPTQRILRKKEK